jgi:hypothetical protein
LQRRKSRLVVDCRDFVFDAVSLQKNNVKREFCGQALSGAPLLLRVETSERAAIDSSVASQITCRYIVTASLVAASADLGRNDTSLPWGGYFDIKANFDIQNLSHSFHHVGLSVDINRGSMDKNAIAYLTKFMKQHRGIRYIERPQIHYGFNGGN